MPQASSTGGRADEGFAWRVVRERRSGSTVVAQRVGEGTRTRWSRSWTTSAVLPQAVGHLGLTGGDEPMGQHRDGNLLDVVGQDVVTPGQGGVGP